LRRKGARKTMGAKTTTDVRKTTGAWKTTAESKGQNWKMGALKDGSWTRVKLTTSSSMETPVLKANCLNPMGRDWNSKNSASQSSKERSVSACGGPVNSLPQQQSAAAIINTTTE
jgi:hypothetical protein